jgi:GntR family transcriptional regulator, transcriptional repressor for pyruvate dehydrogenase complex
VRTTYAEGVFEVATGGVLNNQRNRESALDHVLNAVIHAIINGELQLGDQLPTETELSQNLGVGRNTVREAVKILEAYGVVAIHRPEGTFINTSYCHKMLNPMLYGLLLQKQDWQRLIEMRGALEIGTMFLACHSVTPEDIEKLEATVKQMEQEIHREMPSVDILIELDRCFHSDVIKITGNQMILDVSEYITMFTIQSRTRTTEQVIKSGEIEQFIRKHTDIVDVLRSNDYGSIENVIMSHYEYWKKTK